VTAELAVFAVGSDLSHHGRGSRLRETPGKCSSFVGLHIKGREPDKTPCSLDRGNAPIFLSNNSLAGNPKQQVNRG
jgi:hypothetical protein